MQPIQIFIDKEYVIQTESLELFYRLSASSLVLVVCIVTIFYNFMELKNYKRRSKVAFQILSLFFLMNSFIDSLYNQAFSYLSLENS